MSTFSAIANTNPNKSYEVVHPPSDSVSSLSFSPKANFLVATSWDNQVRCWELMHSGTSVSSVPKASITHDHPVLCSAWKDDGTTVFSGGCDKQVKMWPLLSGAQPMTVAMHDAPVKEISWIPEMNLLVSGSWDKTLRYWDTRQPNPVHIQQLPERCYSLTVKHPLMVVGTADRNLIIFNLQNPQTEYKRIMSPLKYQTRCVAAFPDQQGFLVGSIEGRVGVHHLDDAQQSKNFTFKCHREGTEIYSVNSLNFHPVHGTFATAGSDGAFNFWDKDSKQRLKAMSRCSQPIPCSTFNNDGSIFAYAVCYDWSKGAENHNPATAKTYIFLHLPQVACEPLLTLKLVDYHRGRRSRLPAARRSVCLWKRKRRSGGPQPGQVGRYRGKFYQQAELPSDCNHWPYPLRVRTDIILFYFFICFAIFIVSNFSSIILK